MKIMFYYGTMNMGGSERVISSLANDFVERGAEVSIMVTDNLPSAYLLDQRVRFINQDAEISSSGFVEAIKNNLYRVRLNRKYLREIRPDVVMCFAINNLTLVLLANLFRIGRPKVVGFEPSNPYLSQEGRFWKKMKQIASPFADGYIFSTEGVKNFYPKKTQDKSTLIPTGAFATTIPVTVPPLDQRTDNTICAVGRLHPVKAFDNLIRAFGCFHEDFPDYTLHIYGEGQERAALAELINQLNLKDSVFLEGYVVDIPRKLCENTMFVLSSLHEGMPNALIEALACGLPCIAANCEFGPAELITDGQNGLLVPVGDVEAMAQAMRRVAEDKALAASLANNALKIRATHSREKIANRFYDYITSVK